MNEIITNNLFEFWNFIGQKNNIFRESSNYKAVYVIGSDWPKRVFDIKETTERYEEIIKLSNDSLLPNIITLDKHTDLINYNKTQLRFTQTNMCLDLNNYKNEITNNDNIHQIKSKSDRKSTRLNSSHVKISYAVFCYLRHLDLLSFPTRRSSDLEEIIKLSNDSLLPNIITLDKHTDLINYNKTQLRFTQTNMCLDLNNYKNEITNNDNIHQIKSKSDRKSVV